MPALTHTQSAQERERARCPSCAPRAASYPAQLAASAAPNCGPKPRAVNVALGLTSGAVNPCMPACTPGLVGVIRLTVKRHVRDGNRCLFGALWA